jgi:hypothetical protein
MQSLRVTLYEIFGYFAPGLIGIAALVICVWAVYFPVIPLSSDVIKLRPVFFCIVAFAAYIFGHLLQAVGNLHIRAEKRKKLCSDCQSLQTVAVEALKARHQIAIGCESLSDITALAFGIMSQIGKTDSYEVFDYREGFYRAGYISLALLAISILLRSIHPAFVSFQNIICVVPESLLILSAILSIICSFFFLLRFRRFGEYRVKHVLAVISVIPAPTKSSNLDKNED